MEFNSYKAMVYFIVATLYFYKNEIRYIESSNKFFDINNLDVLTKVKHEAIMDLNYEISYNQMLVGISEYIQNEFNLVSGGVIK